MLSHAPFHSLILCEIYKGPSIIVNIEPSVQKILLGGGVNGKKMLIPYIFNILTHLKKKSFAWQIIYLKNVDVYTF